MANKQIIEYITPLADTDSLLKQSIGGLTGKTTVADLKANLDGRYTQRGTVIWEEEGDYSPIVLPTPLSTSHNYEVYVNVYTAETTAAKMVLKGSPSPSGEPWITFISYGESSLYVAGIGTTESQIAVWGRRRSPNL